MQNTINQTFATQHTALFAGFGFGFLSSVFLLGGDQYGQVNILILLGLFVGVPVLGVLLSILPLTIAEPQVIHDVKAKLLSLWGDPPGGYNERIDRLVVLYHGQYAGVGLGLGSVFALTLLLVFTDMYFVWRSTLLTPELLFPILQAISLPWVFWDSAQPSIELLASTQDSRLHVDAGQTVDFKKWWPFIIACQLCYAFLLRLLVMAFLRLRILNKLSQQEKKQNSGELEKMIGSTSSSKPVHVLPKDFTVVNWAGFSGATLEQLQVVKGQRPVITAGPLAPDTYLQESDLTTFKLILVKAWEPPLQELKDYLDDHRGGVYPIEMHHKTVCNPKKQHIDEWQRFVSMQPGWSVFIEEASL